MKIKELGLLSFGKFHNKNIILKDGINLIYGHNESGKSTIFSFISGMLYGFSRDSQKRRLYDEDKEKYKPWIGQEYKGFIEIKNKYNYRVERDFNDDELKFINLDKALDLSKDEKLTKFTKVKQPGAYILDVNKNIFLNTFFVGQLETRVDENAYESLKEKISNLSKSNDENINSTKACLILEEELKKLGKESRKSSEIGYLTENIKLIRSEIYELENVKNIYDKELNVLTILNKEIDEINKNINKYEKIEEQKIYNSIIEKKDEIEKIKSINNDTLKDDYERVLDIEKELYSIEEELSKLNKKLLFLKDDNNISNTKEIEKDYDKIHKINDEIRVLNSRNLSKEMEFLLVDIKESKNKVTKLSVILLLALVVSIIIVFIAFYFKIYFLALLIIIPAIYSYIKTTNYKVNKELINRLETRMEELKKDSFEKTSKKREYDKDIENLILKYNLEDEMELEKYLREKLKEETLEKYKNETISIEKKDIKEKIDYNINVRKKDLEKELSNIAIKYNILNLKDLKSYFIEHSAFNKNEKINSIEKLINMELKNKNLNELNHNIEIEDCDLELEKDKLREKNIEKIKIREQLNILEKDIKYLEDLIEDLNFKEKILEELNYKKNETELALNNIKMLLGENRDTILPKLMEKMSLIISKITMDKYSNILIDKNFNIKIKDKEINSFIDLESLSSGTIDQVYFAFRIALIDILFKDAPIILDDHFLQYDDYRLDNTIKYINELSKNRQIILFSATDREKNSLEKNNIEYNYINLRWI